VVNWAETNQIMAAIRKKRVRRRKIGKLVHCNMKKSQFEKRILDNAAVKQNVEMVGKSVALGGELQH